MMEKNWYWIEETKENTIRILRVFGKTPVVILPEKIEGKAVTEVGAYCFSQKRKDNGHKLAFATGGSGRLADTAAEELFQSLLEQDSVVEICGKYVEEVWFPDSIETLGNFAFYQCSRLRMLEVGTGLSTIGSDAFMNCPVFSKIRMHASVTESTCLRQILAQRSTEMTVTFEKYGVTEALLLYPEYMEYYDEIGPAHIFELNIAGEGFRARQCFVQGVVSLAQYDAIFEAACAQESETTLCLMAIFRLMYPTDVTFKAEKQYEQYLKLHEKGFGKYLVHGDRQDILTFVLQKDYLSLEGVECCIAEAVEKKDTKMVALLMEYQGKKKKDMEKKEEYSFEDF